MRPSLFALIGLAVGTFSWSSAAAEVRLFMPQCTVEVGETFTMPVLLDSGEPVSEIQLTFENDGSRIQFISWTIGEGMEAYINENGQPPCDVLPPTDTFLSLFMAFDPPLLTWEHGSRLMYLEYRVREWSRPGVTRIRASSPQLAQPFIVPVEMTPAVSLEVLRGDVNNDTFCNLADALSVLNHLFANGPPARCPDAADVNDDGTVAASDAIHLLNNLFSSQQSMQETCRRDGTQDSLPACAASTCAA